MKSNFHTHSTFCDGKNTIEEVVLCAIDAGFDSLGFSGHGYTDFDNRYCMQNTEGYINEVKRVKEKYKDKIQIYLGVEEDMCGFVDRSRFDYILGACHYYAIDGKYYDVDGSYEHTLEALKAVSNDVIKLADNYYRRFCDYILSRKPDIVAHFDLLTKFDEKYDSIFSHNKDYHALAKNYLLYAMKSNCIFEVNTGAISRGYRKTPYPSSELLYTLYKNDGKIIVNSDCHAAENLESSFDEAIPMLKDIGFKYTYVLYDGKFTKTLL
ncbi:MAG: histidinol-phosphatase HisJ family protein [Clostridia bacterium]|nr:histidinol-phosphatase HisJ family protein [Clostridia bacterium]